MEEATPSQHLVTRVVASEVPFSGAWIFSLKPEGENGTVLQMQENREVTNPLYRLPVRLLIANRANMDAYLIALGKKLGETITPE